jgi:hypothetical protein
MNVKQYLKLSNGITELTGKIKGYNFFGGVKNSQTLVGLWAGALSCNKKKSPEQIKQDEPAECVSGGDPLLLYKILHLIFVPRIRIRCSLRL